MTKENLKDYASKLMFDMEDSEYETLEKEFKVMVGQMNLIGNIKGIDKVKPMTFPFTMNEIVLRNDSEVHEINVEDAFSNTTSIKGREVKVPKVVE